jgi:protein-export membrane protein SecD
MLYFARWKIALIVAVLLAGLLYALPSTLPANMRDALPGFLPQNTIKLGLDLQGGSHLLFEVDMETVRSSRLEAILEDAEQALREEPNIPQEVVREGDSIVAHILAGGDVAEAERRLRTLAQPISGILIPGQANPRILDVVREGDSIRLTFSQEELARLERDIVEQSLEVIRRRIDEFGTTEPNIQRQGANRILVQAPGVSDPERLKELVGQTAVMTFHLLYSEDPNDVAAAASGRVPPNAILAANPQTGEQLLLRRRPLLSGDDLTNASQGFHPDTGLPIVNFSFGLSGARTFGEVTAENVGRRFAILLDGEIITAPVIQGAITGGSGLIEGGFTVQTAQDLATLLNAGALPAPLTVEEQRTVTAELGVDSIRAGLLAGALGLVCVIIFMVVMYGTFGVIANLALIVNIVLIMGALGLFGATLTLPGIAGVILTMGMAVDANVLVYERIREEDAIGRSMLSAIEIGYSKAIATIMDANITTMIAALILYQFGSGPVRGFAITLGIGIITSVFTAFVVARWFTSIWLKIARPKKLHI